MSLTIIRNDLSQPLELIIGQDVDADQAQALVASGAAEPGPDYELPPAIYLQHELTIRGAYYPPARHSSTATVAIIANANFGGNGVVSGPTAYLPPSQQWQLIDLGAFTIPSGIPTLQDTPLSIRAVIASQSATYTLDVSDLIVLPDGQTVFLDTSSIGEGISARGGAVFDASANESWTINSSGNLQARTTGIQRGVVPNLPPSNLATSSLVALILKGGPGAGPANELINASVKVRERVRFAF